jgi:hypothetical protein
LSNSNLFVQELYDATTILHAVLRFTHTSDDLLSPELDAACRRVLAARSACRMAGIVEHRDAGLIEPKELPEPFDRSLIARQ